MIFSDKKINDAVITVRFYQYMDTERGYGDAGTLCYKNIPLSEFEEKRKPRSSGGFYYTYNLNTEYGKKLFGNYWWIDRGYDLSDDKKRLAEIKGLENQLKKLKSIT